MTRTKPFQPIKIVLRDYIRETWKHKYLSVPSLLLPGIGSTLIFYVPPLIIASAIRDFNGAAPSDLTELIPYLVALAAAWLIGELCWHVSFLMMARYQSRVISQLNINALDEILKRDANFFNNNFTGSLTKRVTTYAANYERFLDTLSFNIAGNVLPLLFAVIILWTISPWLVVALTTVIALTFVIIVPLIKRRMKLVRIREAASTKVSGHVADIIGNISAVQSFAHEDVERKNHIHYTKTFTDAMYTAWDYDITRIHRTVSPLNVATNILGLIIAIIVSKDSATMAAVFVTFNYFLNATRVMFEFNNIYRGLESTLSGSAEYTSLLEQSPEISDIENASKLNVTSGTIAFENVTFAYPESKNQPLFKDLSVTIPAGQKVALVGHSGGGKSSITRLILRFSNIDAGAITIDTQDIARSTLKSLRQSIAYVPQDPAMFHRNIMENIRYGKLNATEAQVIDAAKKAHALEFIEKLPDGFDTIVGERGVKLSGGQRQRIAIARAILKDAPILVLDEATSALDSESEKLIQSALEKLMKNRTSIVIAHRLSTIAKLDRIIVLDNGKIIEDGPHDELLAKRGTYASLWSHQSGGFIED